MAWLLELVEGSGVTPVVPVVGSCVGAAGGVGGVWGCTSPPDMSPLTSTIVSTSTVLQQLLCWHTVGVTPWEEIGVNSSWHSEVGFILQLLFH